MITGNLFPQSVLKLADPGSAILLLYVADAIDDDSNELNESMNGLQITQSIKLFALESKVHVPFGQSLQLDVPGALEYFPRSQEEQLVVPSIGEY